jgi:prepilin-type N-terminal cleavage/methylation domain-containing protein
MMKADYTKASQRRAFTLIELLASMAILSLIMVMLFSAFEQISKAWTTGESRVEVFTQARAVLDLMSRELSQAVTTNNIPFFGQKASTPLGTVPVNLSLDNIAFVASVGDSIADGMDLMEVVYRLSRQKAGVPEPPMGGTAYFIDADPGPYKLIRRASGFSGTPGNCRDYGNFAAGIAAPWDFYGAPVNPNWPETSDSTRTAVLADNVLFLQFRFQDAQPTPAPHDYWNSTTAVGWQAELGGGGVLPSAGPFMQDRAPALVFITLKMLDSKTALRYSATPDKDVRKRIYQDSSREFTTIVAIPNRQQ